MEFGLDVWEGSLDIDEPVLRENGISFLIPRLNSISGILHKDDLFDVQWEQASSFLRAPYFVYTPWETGKINAEWLLDNIPTNAPRFFADIEVRKLDYPPKTYAAEIASFFALTDKYYKSAVYTGGWFLDVVAYWPIRDYWWGRYPYFLYPDKTTYISWQEFYDRVEYVGWYPDPYKLCPGTVKVWQCTGDRYILPGTASRVMDVNIWRDTFDDLVAWWGGEAPVNPPPVATNPTIKLVTLMGDIRVRTGPSIYASIVGKVPAGYQIDACGFGGSNCWAKIQGGQYDGKWIAIQYNSLKLLDVVKE